MAGQAEQSAGARPHADRPHDEDSGPGGLSAEIPAYPASGLLERGLDLLFPPTCVGCRRVGRWICAACWPQVRWLPRQACSRCGAPVMGGVCPRCRGVETALGGAVSVAEFEGIAREAVHGLKYDGHHAIGSMMGKLMAARVSELPATLVAPISLHPRRRRERGYDQAAILAGVVARSLDLPCENVLERIRYTRQQVTLDGDARRRNVMGAFEARRELEGERIILVDDVFTTGATMEEAAETLRAAGVESVIGLAFAHAVAEGRSDAET